MLHGEFTEDAVLTDPVPDPITNATSNRLLPAGSTIPFAPEITATAGIQYEFTIGNSTLTPRVQLSYID